MYKRSRKIILRFILLILILPFAVYPSSFWEKIQKIDKRWEINPSITLITFIKEIHKILKDYSIEIQKEKNIIDVFVFPKNDNLIISLHLRFINQKLYYLFLSYNKDISLDISEKASYISENEMDWFLQDEKILVKQEKKENLTNITIFLLQVLEDNKKLKKSEIEKIRKNFKILLPSYFEEEEIENNK